MVVHLLHHPWGMVAPLFRFLPKQSCSWTEPAEPCLVSKLCLSIQRIIHMAAMSCMCQTEPVCGSPEKQDGRNGRAAGASKALQTAHR
jgi:hypothetical protein